MGYGFIRLAINAPIITENIVPNINPAWEASFSASKIAEFVYSPVTPTTDCFVEVSPTWMKPDRQTALVYLCGSMGVEITMS